MGSLLMDRAAVVTGASSGNGRAIARQFAEHGADVVVADIRKEPRLEEVPTHELIERETDSQAAYVDCDVSNLDDLEMAITRADEFGGVDVLVNNAGISLGPDFLQSTEEDFHRTMTVNMKAVYFGSQFAGRRMKDSEGGSIINISSIYADFPSGSAVPYSASKGGVKTMTYALADALGPTVRVNAIHPGTIETAMTVKDSGLIGSKQEQDRIERNPLNRIGTPRDVANVAVFLASDLAQFVNAESITVDGGDTRTR